MYYYDELCSKIGDKIAETAIEYMTCNDNVQLEHVAMFISSIQAYTTEQIKYQHFSANHIVELGVIRTFIYALETLQITEFSEEHKRVVAKLALTMNVSKLWKDTVNHMVDYDDETTNCFDALKHTHEMSFVNAIKNAHDISTFWQFNNNEQQPV
jgi:hypothetical protein